MKTKQVRIALAIDSEGHWVAHGESDADDENAVMNVLELYGTNIDEPFEPVQTYWVEAEVEIPEDKTVQGTVTPERRQEGEQDE